MKIIVNPDIKVVKEIRQKLNENKDKYGKMYCPCVAEWAHSDDTVCMCKEFREMNIGECHCGLYIKIEEDNDC